MLSVVGIIIGLVVMIFLAYKGISLFLVTIIAGAIVALFDGLNPMEVLTSSYMVGFTNFMKNYFILFLFASMFGSVTGASGAARGISNGILKLIKNVPAEKKKFWSVMVMTLINLVLGYGGVNGFVIIYTTVAISKELYKEVDLPWHLSFLTTIASACWNQGFLPGTPSVQNMIPTGYLGTPYTSGMAIGLICSVFCGILWFFYVMYCLKKANKTGEGFFPSGESIDKASFELPEHTPSVIKSLIPSIVLLVLMNGIKLSIYYSMLIAILVAIIMFYKELGGGKKVLGVLTQGALNATSAVTSTCSCTGFGGVVSSVSGYGVVLGALTSLPGPPIFQYFLAVSVAAGATGSGSGGLSIALDALGQRFVDMGINPQILHRIGAMACCSLDTLPHNGAIVNSLMVSHLTHKQGYGHIFVQSVVITTLGSLLGCVLATMGLV